MEALYAGLGRIVEIFRRFDLTLTDEVDKVNFRRNLTLTLTLTLTPAPTRTRTRTRTLTPTPTPTLTLTLSRYASDTAPSSTRARRARRPSSEDAR